MGCGGHFCHVCQNSTWTKPSLKASGPVPVSKSVFPHGICRSVLGVKVSLSKHSLSSVCFQGRSSCDFTPLFRCTSVFKWRVLLGTCLSKCIRTWARQQACSGTHECLTVYDYVCDDWLFMSEVSFLASFQSDDISYWSLTSLVLSTCMESCHDQ